MRTLRIALVALAVLAVAGCNPINFLPGPGGTGTPGNCLVGVWNLDSEQIQSPITTPLGTLEITTSGNGTSLTFGDTTWELKSDTVLNATFKSQFGTFTGELDINADAKGTYTADGTKITFTLGSVTGTVGYNATIFGQNFSGSIDLASSGLQKLVGLSGSADYTCSPTSGLSFTLPPISVHAKH
jgi:hypothetical protein